MSEKITSIEVIPVNMPLKEILIMSIGQVDISQHIIVKVNLSGGIIGLGEAAFETGPSFSYECQQSAFTVIQDYLAGVLIGMDVSDVEEVVLRMDKIAKGNPFAKSAIEMAVFDAWAKVMGVPLYKLLGGKVREAIVNEYGLHSMDIKQEVSRAIEKMQEGYKLFKMKVGAENFIKDLERIQAVREALGFSVRIGIDANGAWRVKDAAKFIQKIEPYDLDFVEQPIARNNLKGMAELRRNTTIPIMADESVFSPEDALRVVELEAADIISIKIGKAGGLIKAKKIAAIAEAAGLSCYIGNMAEGGIGAAAGLHFAISTPNADFGCELEPPYDQDIVNQRFIIQDGYIKVPEGIGLGVSLVQDNKEKPI